MRYFMRFSYDGTAYGGWQRQPNTRSIQEVLEDTCTTLLRETISMTGCGRTDAGVHAEGFYAHFDAGKKLSDSLPGRLNRMLPPDIVIQEIRPVHDEAHARFDAIQRGYRYRITLTKDPFLRHFAWQYPFPGSPDVDKLNAAAALLLQYNDFSPFCKTNTDAATRRCDLRESFWVRSHQGHLLEYHVTSDRFLRGMIRLIVGMCIRVAAGKTSLSEVQHALDTQTLLHGSWTVPPLGLTLREVRYPYL